MVAFSGGVDSSLLLKVAKDVLKRDVIAVTAVSPLYPKEEFRGACRIAHFLKGKHIIIRSREYADKNFIKNPRNRCYYCKLELFKKIKKIAARYGYNVLEASNQSDLRDFRPGLIAVKRLGIKSPLIEAGIKKDEVRAMAKKFRLPNWNKPAMACLASRIPYGRTIDKKTLKRIESAERYLKKFKLTQVRVRDHFPSARIEVQDHDLKKVLSRRSKVVEFFKKLGYKYITLDLEGYQMGSLNR